MQPFRAAAGVSVETSPCSCSPAPGGVPVGSWITSPRRLGSVTDCLRLIRRVRPGRAGPIWEAVQPSAGERSLPKNDSPGSPPRSDCPIWNKCTFSINCLYFSFKERRRGGGWKAERKGAIHIYEASVTADRPHRREGETLASVQETQTYGMKQ